MAQGVLSVCGEATSRPVKSLKNASSPSRHHALTHTNTRFKIEEKKEYPDEFKWGANEEWGQEEVGKGGYLVRKAPRKR